MMRWVGLMFLAMTISARAAPLVSVADFDFVDSSGEARDQTAQHEQRMKALKADIIAKINKSGHYEAAALPCGQPICSAGSLDQDSIAKAARGAHAKYVVFGGVHKVSTLIQFGQVGVMDGATGRSVLSRTITFRGDDEAAWQHASDFISQMLLEDLK